MAEATPCGSLACQRDTYLQSLAATVVSCAPGAAAGTALLVLSDTVLFPEGGGQPCDFGTLQLADGASVAVSAVENRGGQAVHVCSRPLEPGTPVTVVLDWQHRWELVQQHSAQHLLTARALQLGLPTVAWALGESVCTLDLDLSSADGGDKPFGEAELRSLEATVNADIRRGAQVKTAAYVVDAPELAAARTRGLPAGVTGESRVIEIEGDVAGAPMDRNMCCGTHVSSLAHLQVLSLLSGACMVVKKKPIVRLTFVAGDRALRRLAADHARSLALTKLLSAQPEDQVARVEALKASCTAAERSCKRMLDELAAVAVQEALAQAEAGAKALRVSRRLDAGKGMEWIKMVASLLSSEARLSERLVFLSASEAEDGEEGVFALCCAAAPQRVTALAPAVAAAVEGRGGGGKGVYQGKAARLTSGWQEVQRLLEA